MLRYYIVILYGDQVGTKCVLSVSTYSCFLYMTEVLFLIGQNSGMMNQETENRRISFM